MQKELKEIIKKIAEECNFTENEVEEVISSYFNFLKHKISKIPYRNLESFKEVKTNFMIPGFGKLVVKNKGKNRLKNEKRFKVSKSNDVV